MYVYIYFQLSALLPLRVALVNVQIPFGPLLPWRQTQHFLENFLIWPKLFQKNIWADLGHCILGASSKCFFGHFECRYPSGQYRWDLTTGLGKVWGTGCLSMGCMSPQYVGWSRWHHGKCWGLDVQRCTRCHAVGEDIRKRASFPWT